MIPEDYANNRKIYGLAAACISVFIYLYSQVFFDYLRSKENNKQIDWDVKTITAGDYTIEFDLEEGEDGPYETWKRKFYDRHSLLTESQ